MDRRHNPFQSETADVFYANITLMTFTSTSTFTNTFSFTFSLTIIDLHIYSLLIENIVPFGKYAHIKEGL